ncbi:hypothetical protein CSKR_112653 [Clonorchis sinensis]|uniref:Uncharacterized protein n=1 Tax=Clonorchis sinensis TaxID=79923 RepID=A0A3R7GF35_CLOSI|nr:hypothetical protein CSKR_112653 [Clonorchis sinensis]
MCHLGRARPELICYQRNVISVVNERFSWVPGAAQRPPHVGTIFEISQYIFIKETTHKVDENALTAHNRFALLLGAHQSSSAVHIQWPCQELNSGKYDMRGECVTTTPPGHAGLIRIFTYEQSRDSHWTCDHTELMSRQAQQTGHECAWVSRSTAHIHIDCRLSAEVQRKSLLFLLSFREYRFLWEFRSPFSIRSWAFRSRRSPPVFYLTPNWTDFEKYTNLQINLETSQTGDSAGFQVSLSQNQIDLQISVFLEISPIWGQVENWGTAPT